MKVAMISDWYPPKLGGVETLVHELAKHLDKKPGIEVEVITQDFSSIFSFHDKIEEEDGVKVRRLAGITGPIWKVYFHPELPLKMKALFKEEDYDVIHTHHIFTLLSVLSTLVAKEMHPRRKCIATTNHTYHAKSISRLFAPPRLFASYSTKAADRVFVGSEAASKIVEDICDPSKIRKVRYGVPLDGFNPKKKSKDLRNELGVESDTFMLFVGRFGKRKGVEYLIRALKRAEDKLEEAKLVLVGKGPKEKTYREMIDKMGLEDKVIIAGYQPKEELQKFYASCDFTVFPSVRDESFGRVLPEAMASGKPYIATDIPGFDEVFEEGTGYLVPPKDTESLAEKVVELHENVDIRKEMGDRGREMAEEKFGWGKIVDKTVEVYDEVISQV